jgi:hypothetical protein
VEACTRETTGSANLTAEIERDRTYNEEGFPWQCEASFELEPRKNNVNRRKTEKELEKNDIGGS